MEPLSVLVANEPRAYRDALAGAFAVLRSDPRVESLAPDALVLALDRPRPPAIVCSRLTPGVEARACAWIVRYPDHESVTIVRGPAGGSVVPDTISPTIRSAAGSCGADADPGGPTGRERDPMP